ncbi:hypothetical protein COV16_05120, partial [Candidatus Woesearchaeota archaeon CG10_big_fil_rev_8_21_14_0_10_34_8]
MENHCIRKKGKSMSNSSNSRLNILETFPTHHQSMHGHSSLFPSSLSRKNVFLIDAYRHKNNLVLWMKNKDRDFYLLKDIDMEVYLDPEAEDILKKHSISYKKIIRKNFLEKSIPVLAVKSPPEYEKFIRYLEQITRYRIPLYNADIPP